MSTEKLSDCFNVNFKFLKVFALWPGRESTGWFKLYSVIFLIITLIIYDIFLTLSLLHTPLKVDLWIKEVTFYFTEIAVTAKACMIIFMRKKILESLNILDGEIFNDKDEESKEIMTEHLSKYKTLWKALQIWANFGYSFRVFCPFLYLAIFPNKIIELPICSYYFLSEEVVSKYFAFWYLYQSAGIYGHMQYNVNIDTLIAGFILMAIVQVKILNRKLVHLKSELNDEKEVLTKFRRYLKHYQVLKQYCSTVQDIISITMFVQFSMASMIICVVLTSFTLPSTVETFMFMITYLVVMVMEIFMPAWLGTYLVYESEKLAFAAYSSEWIPRSEGYMSTLKLFLQQSMVQITFTGWRLFPLSLNTFVSIIKTAYSFFTLIRNVQDREVKPN